jgi:L-threonylcarbamoyladenylate synthase
MSATVSDTDLAAAVDALRAGQLVAFPTETVYGLGANARDPVAVARLYAAKGRPADHPVIVHIGSVEDLPLWARDIPPAARALAARFWPGPLTLVLKRANGVRDAITGGQDTVAVRCPAHPVALRLLAAARAAGIDGIVAPSANRFGRISPTTAAHVREELGDAVAVVLDGGPCAVGIESTIADVSAAEPRVLRPGMLTAQDIADCLGSALGHADAAAPRVSGALPAHYAPRTPLVLLAGGDCANHVHQRLAAGERVAVLAGTGLVQSLGAHAGLRTLTAAPDADGYARALYANLRELDAAGCALIVVEAPPPGAAWRGIADRLQRAAQGHSLPPA